MKKERLLRKTLSLVLCLTALTASLSGCGKNKGGESLVDQATQTNKDYVFKREMVDLGDDYLCNALGMAGDRLYVTTIEKGGSIQVFSMNTDGSDIKSVAIPEKDNESHGNCTFDENGNMYCIYHIYDYSDFDDGDAVLYNDETGEMMVDTDPEAEGGAENAEEGNASEDAEEKKTADAEAGEASEAEALDTDPEAPSEDGEDIIEMDGEQQFLVKYDPSGKELYRVNLLEGWVDEELDYFNVNSLLYSKDAGLLMSSVRGIEVFDEDSRSFKTIVDTRDASSEYRDRSMMLVQGFQGKIFTYFWGDEGIELRTLDPATGKLGEASQQFKKFGEYGFFGGNGYDLYYSTEEGFFGYDLAGDSVTKIMDYADSDLTLNYSINTAVAISDTEFFANLPDEESNYRLMKLTKIPADQVVDKTIITLAGNYVDYQVRQRVYKFNEENQQYKIKVVDYSRLVSEGDYNAGVTQMNLDIASGNVPDIMWFTAEQPVDSYINKGLFLDLSTYIKNDPDMDESDFIENIYEAFKTNGKLYQIAPEFNVETVATKASYTQGSDHVSIKDCQQMIEGMGIPYADSFGIVTKDEILKMGLVSAGSSFIDWEKKSCNFNGQEFIDFIEFVNKFPEKLPDNPWENFSEANYAEGKSLFTRCYLNNYRAYKRYKEGTFMAPIALTGFPNEFGTNGSIIYPTGRFCVSAKSKYSDVCWEFIRYFFLDEYQDSIEYGFPVKKSSFEKEGEKSKERLSWIDDEGQKHYEDDVYWAGDERVVIPPLNDEDVAFVKEYITSLHKMYNANDSVYNIITEEVAAFFSGQKTSKEVADIIQSRVSIYVNENS